ncbi:unnamed protein product [Arabis nemorensis]|uniref:F-box domain-containing protein n=1 Tax=Arabis nemorensis TaxID=586526 RepID=A0A565CJ90_9BRAS|nr:unnamed protein product [Arabis nemorensis]
MSLEQSCRKKTKETSLSPSCGLSCLPDEMALDCFARVSRIDHASLSTVSKIYRSLVVSAEFYETRSRMGCKEECVYVYLDTPSHPNPRWFILRQGKGESFADNRLIQLPSFPTPEAASFVSLGWGNWWNGRL